MSWIDSELNITSKASESSRSTTRMTIAHRCSQIYSSVRSCTDELDRASAGSCCRVARRNFPARRNEWRSQKWMHRAEGMRECAWETEFVRADWPVIPMILSHRPLLPSPLFPPLPFVTGDDFNPRIVTRLARFRVSSTCSRRSHVDQLAANQWLRFVFSRGYRNTDNGGLFECQWVWRRCYFSDLNFRSSRPSPKHLANFLFDSLRMKLIFEEECTVNARNSVQFYTTWIYIRVYTCAFIHGIQNIIL